MKTLLLILTTLLISGCSCDPVPCTKQKCLFPKLPTYKIPTAKKLTPPIKLEDGRYAFVGTEIKECLRVNAIMRKACRNYAYINKKVNGEYQ